MLTLPLIIAACGHSPRNQPIDGAALPKGTKKATATKAKKRTPISCFRRTGLRGPETGGNFWQATNRDGTVVRVERYDSAGKAKSAVKAAAGVAAAQAGRYAVFGPSKLSDDGSTAKVATCLKSR